MAAPVVKNFTQAVLSDTGTVSSPSDTSIGDLVVCFVWSQFTTTATTHTIQSGYTLVRTHSHNDSTTCGRLSVATKVATAAGVQSYVPFAIASATAGQTCAAILTVTGADTTAPGSWIQNSLTDTSNAAPNPPSVTTLNGDALVLAIGAWHVTTAAATTTTQGANYVEKIDGPTGTHVTHLAVASRALTGLSSSTEDPAIFTDNVTPNGSVSMTIAIPYIPTPSLSTLSPSSVNTGGSNFTLTVNGSGFLSNAVVFWNGAGRTTAFVNSTQLTATILAADIVSAGSVSVTAQNSGGAVSNALTFTITVPSQVTTRQRRASVIGLDGIYRMVLPAPNTSVTGWDRCQLAGKYIGYTSDGVVSALQFRNRTDSRFRFSPSFPC